MFNRFSFMAILVVTFAMHLVGQTTVPISQIIQAEDFAQTSGVGLTPIVYNLKDAHNVLRHCANGNWARYDSVFFGTGFYDSVTFYYWCDYGYNPGGSSIQLRLDSPTGTSVATFSGIQVWGGYGFGPARAGLASLSSVTGMHTVYITFQGGSNICDFNKFILSGHMSFNAGDAQTYYVDATNGDNSFDGLSTDHPFKSIQKASAVMKPGSRSLIRQGIYREIIRPWYTGAPAATLSYEAYNGENVVISGGDPVTGWSVHSGNIYKASMPWSLGKYSNQIIVNGSMAWVARSPNVDENYTPDPNDWNLPLCGGSAGIQDYRPWRGRADPLSIAARICFGNNGSFNCNNGNFHPYDMAVSLNSSAAVQYRLPAALFGRAGNFFSGGLLTTYQAYWQQNGEIVGSSSSASQTTLSANGWNSMTCDHNGAGWISHVFGLLDAPNEWYRDSATQTLYLWAPGGVDPSTRLVEAKRRTLGLDLRGKAYVNVTGLRFLATSATLANASNCVLDRCHFKYVSHKDVFDWFEMGSAFWDAPFNCSNGYSGIYISGSNNTFKNGSVGVSAHSGIILDGLNNTVTNNHIHDCDYTVSYQAGILVYKRYIEDPLSAIGLSITHNTFAHCGRGNVQVAWAGSPQSGQTDPQRLKIMYNDFGPAAYSTKETGSLSCQGSSFAEVSYNWFHGTAGTEQSDIVMESDFGATHYTVHHNVFYQDETVNRGVRLGNEATFAFYDTGANGAKCFNNTFVDSLAPNHRDVSPAAWPGFKANNIWCNSDTAPWKFTDPVNRDYSLTAASTRAIDKGVLIPNWVGAGDYVGAAPDLGAYEYGKPRWVAGADWQEQPWVYPPSGSPVTLRGIGAVPTILGLARLRILPGKMIIDVPKIISCRLSVFNALGATVAVQTLERGGKAVIPTYALGAGMFVIQLSSGMKTVRWKIFNGAQ